MKHRILALLCICSGILYSQENSLLWKVTGNGLDKPSYLYGTYHSKDARAHQFGDSVMVKLAESGTVIVECVDMDGASGLGMVMMKDKKLEDLLSKEDYAFVKKTMLEKMGTSGSYFNIMKPLFTMTMMGMLKARKDMPTTVDEYIKAEAKAREKNLYGLETAKEAMEAMDEISLKDQSKMLVDYLKKYDKNQGLTDSMITMYQAQDLKAIYKFYLDNKDLSASFDKSLVIKRNKKFTEGLIPFMKKGSVFCAVGCLHLPGETGLINALREKGFTVVPVYSHYTPPEKK